MEKRWASRSLVALLVEMENYSGAAAVVYGSNDTFSMYSRLLKDFIAVAESLPASAPSLDLQRIITTSLDEIIEDLEWQNEVIATLPRTSEERELTEALRQAFKQAATERNKLLEEVLKARDKYLERRTLTLGDQVSEEKLG